MVGETIGGYRITGKLGEGGMGVVYLGEHQRIARKAAIKVLLAEFLKNQEVVERFFREAMATSRIRHPGIVEIFDCDLLPSGSAYIIMELLEGESLGAHLERTGRLSVDRALLLTRHIADALAAAHDERIVHRDLKPDNVFVLRARAGAAAQPIKIVDFGIAKLLDTDAGQNRHKTRTGSIVGTPVYMSPEQCRGVGEIDHRTDIYSLGCMLFEMLVGRPPFTQEGFGELIQCHLGAVPPALRSLDPSLPVALERLVAGMLAKAPGDRPQTMRDLGAALASIEANVPAMPEPLPRVKPGGTVRMPPVRMPPVQTTLRSSAGEHMPLPDPPAWEAPRRRWAPAVVVLSLGALAAGAGIWRATWGASRAVTEAPAPTEPSGLPGRRPSIDPPARPSIDPPARPSIDPPARPSIDPPAAAPAVAGPTVAVAAPAAAVPTPAPPAASSTKASRVAPAPRKVRVLIASDPPGADVCLASDQVLLGRTSYEWTTEKSTRAVRFMIRKAGYRGQDVTVSAAGDGKKRVQLDKLGPDDIDDVQNCSPR